MTKAQKWFVILAVLAVAAVAFAQTNVIIRSGASTNQATVDANGRLNVVVAGTTGTHGACTLTNTTVNAASGRVPNAALAGRSTVSVQLLTAGATLNCCSGATCTTTTGIALGFMDVYSDNLVSTSNVECICSQAGCSVSSVECP